MADMNTNPSPIGPPAPRLTTSTERIVTIDVLRGVALLGILVMNIRSFAMIEAAYFNPLASGQLSGTDRVVWWLGEFFANQKFMSIFSMLFGAGIVLMYQRRDRQGLRSAGLHYRRMGLLFLIGVLHAYMLWYGDILVSYALCGLWLFLLRKRGPVLLLVLALLFMLVGTLLSAGLGWAIEQMPADIQAEVVLDFAPGHAMKEAETAAYRGGWLSQMPFRASTSLGVQTVLFFFWTLWRAGAMMLLGMALMKTGVLTSNASSRTYVSLLAICLLIGMPLVGAGMIFYPAAERASVSYLFYGSLYNYWGSAFMAVGYVAGILLLCRHLAPARCSALSAVGRMSLTNYLAQTLLCTLLFYGTINPFALFGRVGFTGQLLVVAAVWAVQLVLSATWLKYFRSGPMESLWRRLSYGRRWPVQSTGSS